MFLAREELERKLAGLREEEARQKQRKLDSRLAKKTRIVEGSAQDQTLDDDEFMVDDYDSEEEE
ncbi:ATP-dependent DNA helicase chl1, partial [Friedmanniomyces endolithicus]